MTQLQPAFTIKTTPIAAVQKALHEAGGLDRLVEFQKAAGSGRHPCANTVTLRQGCTLDQAAAVAKALKPLLSN